jgi:hypothetical protein
MASLAPAYRGSMDDSPPPFIIFKRALPSTEVMRTNVYELALQLVTAIHAVVEQAEIRYRVKSQLDDQVTQLVVTLGRMRGQVHAYPWKVYREAHATVVDILSIVDVLGAQGAPAELVGPTRTIARVLSRQLAPLALEATAS